MGLYVCLCVLGERDIPCNHVLLSKGNGEACRDGLGTVGRGMGLRTEPSKTMLACLLILLAHLLAATSRGGAHARSRRRAAFDGRLCSAQLSGAERERGPRAPPSTFYSAVRRRKQPAYRPGPATGRQAGRRGCPAYSSLRICSRPWLLAARQCRLRLAQHTAETKGWCPSPPPAGASAAPKRYWAVLKGRER